MKLVTEQLVWLCWLDSSLSRPCCWLIRVYTHWKLLTVSTKHVTSQSVHLNAISLEHLDTISEEIDIQANDHEALIQAAMTALGSKVVSKWKRQLAKIAVEAVLDVADLARKDVNLDLIKIQTKTGASVEDTKLISGILIDKDISHA